MVGGGVGPIAPLAVPLRGSGKSRSIDHVSLNDVEYLRALWDSKAIVDVASTLWRPLKDLSALPLVRDLKALKDVMDEKGIKDLKAHNYLRGLTDGSDSKDLKALRDLKASEALHNLLDLKAVGGLGGELVP